MRRSAGLKRRWASALLLALIVGLFAGAGLWVAFEQTGRTPGELINYAKRRLIGHPTLEWLALPLLDAANGWLGQPDALDMALPFAVPPLPPNPAASAVAAAPAAADEPGLLRVGPGRPFASIGAAIREAPDGAVIEVDPGDYLADTAVLQQRELTLRGRPGWVRLIARGANAEGKGIWVVRGGRVTVENLQFIGARVADGNGAGIRLERGELTVRHCVFLDNQNGLLTSGDPASKLVIEDSEFGYNGGGDGVTHNLYVGAIGSLRVSGSYFHHANVGHLLKSRARHNRIEYNRLTDESGGRASYELEFPNGGVAEVVGNIIEQGALTRNSAMVSYGAEGYTGPRNELRLVHNTLANDARYGGTFVRVAPGAGPVVLRNNLYVGDGRIEAGDTADAAGDETVDWNVLARPSRYDYRLNERGREVLDGHAVPMVPEWQPRAEFVPPVGTRPLAAPPRWPGALGPAGR